MANKGRTKFKAAGPAAKKKKSAKRIAREARIAADRFDLTQNKKHSIEDQSRTWSA